MKRIFHIALCLFLCTACAAHHPKKQKEKKGKEEEKQKAPAHRLVGTIVAVNEQARFVLIDAGQGDPATAGAALKSFSGGKETGVLAVSPERKPPFVIADIISGSPQKGDEVFE